MGWFAIHDDEITDRAFYADAGKQWTAIKMPV
jgi:hypothetical protein